MRRLPLKIWVLSLLLCACAGQAKKPAGPAVPVPPREPLAWLPEDATFAGTVLLAPFQNTPLWRVWEQLQAEPEAKDSLVNAAKIERALFAGTDPGDRTASFVAVASGAFGARSVEAQATAKNLAPEPHGLLTFYRSGQVAFAQVYPELIVACSFDRIEAVAARASQGDAVKFREGPLFRSLGARLKWSEVDLALIGEDPRGEVKARLERQAGRVGFAVSAQDLVRAGAALKLGPSASLLGVIETTGEGQAEALKATADNAIASFADNLFVGLLGLRPLLSALGTTRDAGYLAVSGTLATDDLSRVLDRVASMLEASLGQREREPAPAAP